jgi:hypothetical protein
MVPSLEDDGQVKLLHRASIAAFAVAISLFFLPAAGAQINGAPSSVTSIGFGGHPNSIHGVAPSVTSLGPRGYTPGYSPTPQNNGLFGVNSGQTINGRRHRPPYGQYYYYPGGYYVGSPYGYYSDQAADYPPDDQYNGGPTIFDRRGSGTGQAVPPAAPANDPPQNASDDAAPTPAPSPDQPSTVLIFKDGHQLEVANYAIVGNTLYDLSEGHRRKIALADLDLTATAKQNDDRGIDFQLPSSAQAN